MTAWITDHALLRYLERVEGLDVRGARAQAARERGVPDATDTQVLGRLVLDGVDIEAYRRSLLTPKVRAAISVGAKSVVCGDHRFIIRDRSVVTTAPFRAPKHGLRPVLRKGQARAMREEGRCHRIDVRDVEMME